MTKLINNLFGEPTPSGLIPERYSDELPPSTAEVAATLHQLAVVEDCLNESHPGTRIVGGEEFYDEHVINEYRQHMLEKRRTLISSCPVKEVPGRIRHLHAEYDEKNDRFF